MAELFKLVCPDCGGKLELKTIDGREFAYCTYCETDFLLESNYTNNNTVSENNIPSDHNIPTHNDPIPDTPALSDKTICKFVSLFLFLIGAVFCVISLSSGDEDMSYALFLTLFGFVLAGVFIYTRKFILCAVSILFGLLSICYLFTEDNSGYTVLSTIGSVLILIGVILFLSTLERQHVAETEHETIIEREVIHETHYVERYRGQKSKSTALFLCVFLGFFGAHKFYEGKTLMGLVYLFTGGIGGIGWLADCIVLLMKPRWYYP